MLHVGVNYFGQGLALAALGERKLRFPVRPKMHSFEHMSLGGATGKVFG